MQFYEISLQSLVSNTISERDGEILRREIETNMRVNQGILVSFRGHGPISTQFVRASLGALLERYGHEVFLQYIRICDTHLGIEDLLCMGYEEHFEAAA